MTSSILLSPSTMELLAALGDFSSGQLTRPDDLGLLYECAQKAGLRGAFDELSFQAKFVHKTRGIIERIGREGPGYERLEAEFGAALARCGGLAREILARLPDEARERFAKRYLAVTPEALQEFLALCHDLSWYKNWHIDRRETQSPPPGSSPR